MLAIERASVEDAVAILELQKLAYQSEARIYNDWTLPPLKQTLESLIDELEGSVVLKATSRGVLVGSVRARVKNDACEIGRLVVHPEHQGRGIGSALLREIEAAFPQVSKYELFTGSRSEGNIRLYRRHGYTITRTQAVSPQLALTFMEKQMVRLRTAVLADAPMLRRWDDEPHVLASDPNDDWAWELELGRSPDWREQLIAEVNGRPMGFIQIIDPKREDGHYWGECEDNLRAVDLWIGEEADLGKGLGTQMMQLALERCFAPPDVRAVIIDPLASNTRAHRFYERLGFELVEPRRFGQDDCFVYRLSRERWRRSPQSPCG